MPPGTFAALVFQLVWAGAGGAAASSWASAETPPGMAGDGGGEGAAEKSAPAAAVPSLCEVARGTDLEMFPLLGGDVLIAAGAPAVLCKRGKPCARLPEDPSRGARRLVPTEAGKVIAAAGRWGEHVVLTRAISRREGSVYEVLELAGGRWRARSDGERGWLPWYPRLVATAGGPDAARDRVVGIAEMASDGARATAKQLLSTPPRPRVSAFEGGHPRTLLELPPSEQPIDVLSLPDGQVMVLVDRVENFAGVPIVKRLPARGGPPVIDRLPSPCAETPAGRVAADAFRIDGRRGDDVYVALGAHCDARRVTSLARFDGRRWALAAGPPAEWNVDDLSVGADGAVWIVAAGTLFRRAAGGTEWTSVAIRVGAEAGATRCLAKQAIARGDGGVLIAAACPAPSEAGHRADTATPSSMVVLGSRCVAPSLGDVSVNSEPATPPPFGPRRR